MSWWTISLECTYSSACAICSIRFFISEWSYPPRHVSRFPPSQYSQKRHRNLLRINICPEYLMIFLCLSCERMLTSFITVDFVFVWLSLRFTSLTVSFLPQFD